MLRTLELILPVLVPSWAFFKAVEASPRIEFCVIEDGPFWREYRPRPAEMGLRTMLCRLLWNPRWNDQLFLVSCAERLVIRPTEHSVIEIQRRIEARTKPPQGTRTVQFRLVFVSDAQGRLVREVEYESDQFEVRAP